MELGSVTPEGFASELGVTKGAVVFWMEGERLPTLPFLYEIERTTGGAVPIEAWVGHPECVKTVFAMRKKRGSAA